ncbi:MAG: hypothetical protein HY560_09745 [Gemmatimonadetes bacterium]|nr:hypothetical protein [Gemmatimonadota bacterium]
MTEFDPLQSAPDDPILDRYLRSLPRLAPRPGFEDRVLARVRKPLPMRVRRARASLVSWASPARLWWASGLAAASSAAWTVALGSWLSGVDPEVATALLVAEVGVPVWSTVLDWIALGSRMAGGWALGVYQFVGPAVFAGAGALALLPMLSAMGLYLIARQPRGRKVRAYAAR